VIDARIQRDVPLGPRTTLGVGGPARHYLAACSEDDVREGLAWAHAQGLAVLVLGGGSNLVVADAGFAGLVLDVAIGGVSVDRVAGGRARVVAGAGETWDDVVARAVAEGLGGIECLSGIPGRVGATPIQNVGAYGQEVRETIAFVRAFDRAHGAVVELGPEECGFDYRTSMFKVAGAARWVVLSVGFELGEGAAAKAVYPELAGALAAHGPEPSVAVVRETVLALRRAKSMVVDPADPESRSAGSFFLNVMLDEDGLARLRQRGRESGAIGAGDEVPVYPGTRGRTKVASAWLIERAGCRRGDALGGARISRKHALALVNGGTATAADVVALARRVQERVNHAFGVELVMEPVLAGFGG
jgi:UDP-N-acetylmuramate dehydrogenase